MYSIQSGIEGFSEEITVEEEIHFGPKRTPGSSSECNRDTP